MKENSASNFLRPNISHDAVDEDAVDKLHRYQKVRFAIKRY